MPVTTIEFYGAILAYHDVYVTTAGFDFSPEWDPISYQPGSYKLLDRGLATLAIMLSYCAAS